MVTTELVEEGGKTMCNAAILYATREARDGAHNSGMEQGVATSYDRLDELPASQRARKASSVEA